MKRFIAVFCAISLIGSLAACTDKTNSVPEAGSQLDTGKLLSVNLTITFDKDAISKDEKFGAALLSMNQQEFEGIGFKLGDSCTVQFMNGYKLTDVPYFNGYYVRNGDPVIVAYPGDPYVRITLNNMGIWDTAGLKEGDTVTIKLEESGKYLATQEALGQMYSFDRAKYPSDEVFCNFREFSEGNLKENFLYRGASPVDNSRNRAPYVDSLLQQNGVKFVIDLADSEEDMKGYISSADFKSAYTKGLYENGSVVLLDMGSAYTSQVYKEKVVQGLRAALASEGPFYIHCMEGKDRTGFVCLLLEALAGAGYDDMMKDYMTTYENYFGVTQAGTPDKFDAIVNLYFVPFMEFLHGTDDLPTLKTADYTEDAKVYLRDGGMTDQEITDLVKLITKS
ncbi:MAG: tyrosine-protein phosphatase [Firmicutes bacterium]|nr:tyrosine-protein phosphatase [Bacillota bacterium]